MPKEPNARGLKVELAFGAVSFGEIRLPSVHLILPFEDYQSVKLLLAIKLGVFPHSLRLPPSMTLERDPFSLFHDVIPSTQPIYF